MSISCCWHTGSVDHNGEEDIVKEQQKKQLLSQEDEAAEPCGRDTDTTPLINETDGKAPNQNKIQMDTEQVKNIPEGIYTLQVAILMYVEHTQLHKHYS